MKRGETPPGLLDAAANFNIRYPVGTQVLVRDDEGHMHPDVIDGPAFVVGGHTPCAKLKIRGTFDLERVRPHDSVEGYLEVGILGRDVVVNLPKDMTGHLKFSASQALDLAALLTKHARHIERGPVGGNVDVVA